MSTNLSTWTNFKLTNRFRRAIRKFSNKPIADGVISHLIGEAIRAPSSVNLQPYEFHWVRSPELKAKIAQACNGQSAAVTASEIIVVVASTALARKTIVDQFKYLDDSTSLSQKSKDYHRKNLTKFDKILKIGRLAVWTPFVSLLTLFRPSLSLLPIGHTGSRQWAARNAVFAAHSLMIAAAAKGIDSCPMEGFSASKVSKLLAIPRGAVIPLVIALGYRADDARIEEQWRRPINKVLHEH